jgi:hypothetical protein
MAISKQLFITSIENMRKHYDQEKARAKMLSEIYGADIDPIDNSKLYDTIFSLLRTQFPKNHYCYIEAYCWDQNFGRDVNKSIETLWKELINDIDVVEPEML